jgi:hypothetical protein
MDITKIGLIGLTLASFVLVPMLPPVDADSSEIALWSSEVYENLNGIHQNYDFQKWSPDLNSMVNGVVNTYKNALNGVVTFYESVNVFFSNPAVLLFGEDDFSDNPLGLSAIPDGRMTQILFASTFLSNQQVVEQVLSEEEILFIISKPLIDSWPWVQGYFFYLRNTIWPISDNSIYYYCSIS